jgi:molybdopterin synthase catalytic subunit
MPGVDVVLAQLSEDPISVDRATAAVQGDEAGAVVSFSGVVRNHDGGIAVSRLSYSAHPTAHHILTEVVTELVAEHAGKADKPVRIWAAHRVGMLQVGDPALVCAVSAAHRGQAFAVCLWTASKPACRSGKNSSSKTAPWSGSAQAKP